MSGNLSCEMREILLEAARPAVAGEPVKAAIGRASRRLDLGFARARAIWYGQARMISAEEADRLRAWRLHHAGRRLASLRAAIALEEARIATMRGA